MATRKKPEGLEALVKQDRVEMSDMTLQDFFAGMAILSTLYGDDTERTARIAYDVAEAMIKEREKRI